MNKIKCVIMSKDRAPQLQLLLDSIELNAPNLFDISVIFKASTKEFDDGYGILRSRKQNVAWIREANFRAHVESLLDTKYKYFAFATDDSIVYRNLDNLLGGRAYEEIDDFFTKNFDVLCYSLRLGENVTHENYYGGPEFPKCYMYSNGVSRAWNWKVMAPSTMGYPLSVDMHVFATQTLKEIVARATFDTPNSLEGNMSGFAMTLPHLYMGSPKLSAVVGNSINRVQDVWLNNAGSVHPISAQELNEKYLDGWIIDIDALDFDKIFAAHAEIPILWKKFN